MNAKLGKLKLQAKAKMTSLQNEKEKLSKDVQEVHTFVNSKQIILVLHLSVARLEYVYGKGAAM